MEVRYLPLYSNYQNQRHNVRSGISGWAPVNGRNAISWNKKFDLDVWYVNNGSFKTDLNFSFNFKKSNSKRKCKPISYS